MKIKKGGKVINLTESDVRQLKKKLIKEADTLGDLQSQIDEIRDMVSELRVYIDIRTNRIKN